MKPEEIFHPKTGEKPQGQVEAEDSENGSVESSEEELSPEKLGSMFNEMDYSEFRSFLKNKIRANPSLRINIVANWKDKFKARQAKALMDMESDKLNIDSITIKATHEQAYEDINAFQSGVKWEEIK